MFFYIHKNRHVVVSSSEAPEAGEVQVAWVALAPGVEVKRGRRPKYDNPVPVADLSPLPEEHATEDLRRVAENILSL